MYERIGEKFFVTNELVIFLVNWFKEYLMAKRIFLYIYFKSGKGNIKLILCVKNNLKVNKNWIRFFSFNLLKTLEKYHLNIKKIM